LKRKKGGSIKEGNLLSTIDRIGRKAKNVGKKGTGN